MALLKFNILCFLWFYRVNLWRFSIFFILFCILLNDTSWSHAWYLYCMRLSLHLIGRERRFLSGASRCDRESYVGNGRMGDHRKFLLGSCLPKRYFKSAMSVTEWSYRLNRNVIYKTNSYFTRWQIMLLKTDHKSKLLISQNFWNH